MPAPGLYQCLSMATDPRGNRLALADGPNNLVRVELTGQSYFFQQWTIVPARGGGYGIVSHATGQCICRANGFNGSPLLLVDSNQIETNDLAVWRDDTIPGPFNAVNSLADWEQKINIPGNGPYNPGAELVTWEWSGGAANERWSWIALA